MQSIEINERLTFDEIKKIFSENQYKKELLYKYLSDLIIKDPKRFKSFHSEIHTSLFIPFLQDYISNEYEMDIKIATKTFCLCDKLTNIFGRQVISMDLFYRWTSLKLVSVGFDKIPLECFVFHKLNNQGNRSYIIKAVRELDKDMNYKYMLNMVRNELTVSDQFSFLFGIFYEYCDHTSLQLFEKFPTRLSETVCVAFEIFPEIPFWTAFLSNILHRNLPLYLTQSIIYASKKFQNMLNEFFIYFLAVFADKNYLRNCDLNHHSSKSLHYV